jgi:hypothetical protein
MRIEDLISLVPPPVHPSEKGNAERWIHVQQALGIQLPSELREFGMTYGTGTFDTLEIWNPFSIHYLSNVRGYCEDLRIRRGLVGKENVPYGVFPDRPGWLPWGKEVDGDVLLCWITEGAPDEWPILLVPTRADRRFQQLRLGLVSFLCQLLSKKTSNVLTDLLGDSDNDEPEVFHPVEENSIQLNNPEQLDNEPDPSSGGIESTEKTPDPQIEWFMTDSIGRNTGARVVLGPRHFQSRYEEFTLYPAWWKVLPAPREQWVRHHLMSWRLGGRGRAGLYNMIPVSWETHLLLSSLETVIATTASYERIFYQIQANYEGANHYPQSLVLRALSAKHIKEGLLFDPRHIELISHYPKDFTLYKELRNVLES